MKIGIITFHSANNYGAVLQCYALSETLKDLGCVVELVDLPLHAKVTQIRPLLRNKLMSLAFCHFREKFLPKVAGNTAEQSVYVFGSDQVWNPQITKSNYALFFGSWVKASIPKIAYAASFGLSTWDYPLYTKTVKKHLESFQSIGVRESTGADICKDVFNVNCDKVLDPTLLRENYKDLFKKRKASNSMVCYIFGKDESSMEQIRNIGEKCNLKPVLLNDARIRSRIKSVVFPSVSKWLSYLESSKFILTDSFHCMVFAIIFKKNFIAIPAIPERAGRMLSLLADLGLESRFFQNIDNIHKSSIILEDIDYTKVVEKLDFLRKESLEFLNNSLRSL
jgi:hypothetical protein